MNHLRDPLTCAPDDDAGEVARRLREADDDRAVVVNATDVVVGLVRAGALDGTTGPVRTLMDVGPSTFRPGVDAAELQRFLREHDRSRALITTSAGVLLGEVVLEDLAR